MYIWETTDVPKKSLLCRTITQISDGKDLFEMHYIRCYFDLGMRVYFNKNTYVQMIDVSQFRQENETFRKLQITATICY